MSGLCNKATIIILCSLKVVHAWMFYFANYVALLQLICEFIMRTCSGPTRSVEDYNCKTTGLYLYCTETSSSNILLNKLSAMRIWPNSQLFKCNCKSWTCIGIILSPYSLFHCFDHVVLFIYTFHRVDGYSTWTKFKKINNRKCKLSIAPSNTLNM